MDDVELIPNDSPHQYYSKNALSVSEARSVSPCYAVQHRWLRKPYSEVIYHQKEALCGKKSHFQNTIGFRLMQCHVCSGCDRLCCTQCSMVNAVDGQPVKCRDCFISMEYRLTFQCTKLLFRTMMRDESRILSDDIAQIISIYVLSFECARDGSPQFGAQSEECDGYLNFDEQMNDRTFTTSVLFRSEDITLKMLIRKCMEQREQNLTCRRCNVDCHFVQRIHVDVK